MHAVSTAAVAMETVEEDAVLRCRRCRMCVVDSSDLLRMCADDADATAECNIWHVNVDPLPRWILTAVQQAAWTMGKLHCGHCGARLGGFSFITRPSCPCGRTLAVHLCKSRVDRDRRCVLRVSPPMADVDEPTWGPRRTTRRLEDGSGPTSGASDPPPDAALRQPTGFHTGACESLHWTPPNGCGRNADGLPSDLEQDEGPNPALRQRVLCQSGMQDGDRESKRDRNRLKSLRRKQRRRERWLQSQLQEHRQAAAGNLSSSEDEALPTGDDREGLTCAVCLDLYFSPYTCRPCGHVFCEPCLRTLAKNCPANTPCPLCRTTITHVFFHKELNHTAKTCFPKEYATRKQNFQKASCAKWPLPSCPKIFRIFGGLRRRGSPTGRRQFPHGGYRLDALAFQEDSRGWRFDMDMVIVYIYSVNWVIGFFVFCFLCYFFISSL
ncbi:LOW QUALITY PROTEIN: E3 ubiquitin-protein ligase RNF180-like [Scleropages formosus]|uniref:LOW QUALITY PROTEIN: E3 ubiquitin-protein ligase RNF180-like n=1 Tax=Scleropages formosus TaxID=113540 RepID=UPI0010FA975E|nr:LOW QUALITY PROTEIN: E3 ubiquitin-protein ligase RNF180 [Scleropages formosus]